MELFKLGGENKQVTIDILNMFQLKRKEKMLKNIENLKRILAILKLNMDKLKSILDEIIVKMLE